mgnify:CR=1 FL=1
MKGIDSKVRILWELVWLLEMLYKQEGSFDILDYFYLYINIYRIVKITLISLFFVITSMSISISMPIFIFNILSNIAFSPLFLSPL